MSMDMSTACVIAAKERKDTGLGSAIDPTHTRQRMVYQQTSLSNPRSCNLYSHESKPPAYLTTAYASVEQESNQLVHMIAANQFRFSKLC
jgi:hypothetical protein